MSAPATIYCGSSMAAPTNDMPRPALTNMAAVPADAAVSTRSSATAEGSYVWERPDALAELLEVVPVAVVELLLPSRELMVTGLCLKSTLGWVAICSGLLYWY